MNRLIEFFDDPQGRDQTADFVEVETHGDLFVVTAEVAAMVERSLDALPPPRWVTFRDLAGTRHRVLAAHVCRISECTAEQRAARRAFLRARRQEELRDGGWEE